MKLITSDGNTLVDMTDEVTVKLSSGITLVIGEDYISVKSEDNSEGNLIEISELE